ncbi:MAG: thiamine pyrophosphate-binding protein, partial [Candidatus Tectomicrobia bacterium]|nr:thiamine pyrophosphate-binding protein [Candidatus Tectomicrobia bacterium]
EVKNHRQMMESVSCWYRRVSAFEEIPGAIQSAFTYLYTSRPGPAVLEIPYDFLTARGECKIPALPTRSRVAPDSKQLERAVNLIKSARFPLIFAGGGVVHSGASSQVRELSERLRIPVVTSLQGRGALPEDHPLSLGCTNGVNPFRGSPTKGPFYERFLRKADVLLSVGTQYDQTTSDGWSFPVPPGHIQIDLDPGQIGKNFPVSEGIVGDAAQVLQGILGNLGDVRASVRPELEEEIAAVKREVQVLLRRRSTAELRVLSEIRQVLPREAILSNDMTQITYWAGRYFPVYEPRTFFFPYGSTTLGGGMPAAIGAKVACPDRPVVALCGDGGFLFTCQELATLAQRKLPLVVVVFNDNCYGVLREFQEERYGRITEVDLVNPDFVKLAEAFGIKGVRVEKLGDLSQALAEALDLGEPVLIEAPAAGFTAPWLSIQ